MPRIIPGDWHPGFIPDNAIIHVFAEQPTAGYDPAGVRLQNGTTRRLLCDCHVQPLITDNLGVPLDLGRSRRLASHAQRVALAARDQGCTFPGCPAPANWTQAHHLDHWIDGGRTDIDNLASDCGHHHDVVHRPGWRQHLTPDGWTWFESPSGERFWGQRDGKQHEGPLPAC